MPPSRGWPVEPSCSSSLCDPVDPSSRSRVTSSAAAASSAAARDTLGESSLLHVEEEESLDAPRPVSEKFGIHDTLGESSLLPVEEEESLDQPRPVSEKFGIIAKAGATASTLQLHVLLESSI